MDAAITDPATELCETFRPLIGAAGQTGTVLEHHFGVPLWSDEFYEILMAINGRIDSLQRHLESVATSENQRNIVNGQLQRLKGVFHGAHMSVDFQSVGYGSPALDAGMQALAFAAPLIRKWKSYPALSQEEIDGLVSCCDQLIDWLSKCEMEHDFMRVVMLDGTTRVRNRLVNLKWLGWEYCAESLRQLVFSFAMVERGIATYPDDALLSAMGKKVANCLQQLGKGLLQAKDGFEVVDWTLRLAGALHVMQANDGLIKLLAGPSV